LIPLTLGELLLRHLERVALGRSGARPGLIGCIGLDFINPLDLADFVLTWKRRLARHQWVAERDRAFIDARGQPGARLQLASGRHRGSRLGQGASR
jgi:hypothetical protein